MKARFYNPSDKMNIICNDNRFEIVEKFKNRLIEATNIKSCPDEMAVIDNILFRFWQLGWLDKIDAAELIRCKDCKNFVESDPSHPDCDYCKRMCWFGVIGKNDYCSKGERKEGETK